VIQHNREVSVASQEEFRYYNRLVMSIRQILNLLGPAVGVWLGYRAASRLRSQIARITVKLGETDLGRVEVAQEAEDTDPADLESLDQQVGRVQLRLMEVVTELQSAQQEVLRSERLAAVGQLAAGVAHELRNPLTSVKLLVQTAQEAAKGKGGGPATVFDPQTFEVLTSEIDRMERTIQSLLDFARPTQPRRTRHDLREPLRRVLNLISARASQQRVAIDCRGGEAPLWVVGDTEQLVQVFLNLTLNGIEAMPEGGRLGLELTRGLAEGSRWVGLRVNDQGPGLSAEVLGRLFEPFVTTKERGTGLGLAVSRRIVLEHSGELLVRNLPAGGAEFELRLPEAEVVQAAVEKPELALVN
jgi:signal transduction histidine kinase